MAEQIKIRIPEKSVWPRIFKIKKALRKLSINDWDWSQAQANHGGSRFGYRTYDNLMSKVSPLLEKQNLCLYFRAAENNIEKIIDDNKVEFNLELVIRAVDDELLEPAFISSPAVGQDNQDISKALGKAHTYTKRYLLLNLFSLSDKETSVEEITEELQRASLTKQAKKGVPSGFKKIRAP